MDKRGISPLIASVLIVGFTIVLAVLVITWLSGVFETKLGTEGCASKGQELCSKLITRLELTATESNGQTTLNLAWVGDQNLIPKTTKVSFVDENGVTQEIQTIDQANWNNKLALAQYNGIAKIVEVTPIYDPSQYLGSTACLEVSCSTLTKEVASGTGGGTGQDVTPPTIEYIPPSDINEGTDLRIRATIRDSESGVNPSQVYVYYKTVGDTNYNSIQMSNPNADTYEATIPGTAITYTGIEYYIEATDNANPSNTEGTPVYSPTVHDITPPTIQHTPPTGAEDQGGFDRVPINAIITDSGIGVDQSQVFVYYRIVGQSYIQALMTYNEGTRQYEFSIGESYITYDGIEYYIEAKDSAGNIAYHGTEINPHYVIVYVTKTLSKTAGGGDYISYDGYTEGFNLVTTSQTIPIGDISGFNKYRGFIDFDTSQVQDGAQIDRVDLILTKSSEWSPQSPVINVKKLAQRAQGQTANVLWNAIQSGVAYIAYGVPAGGSGTAYTINLGASANADLQSQLPDNWFSVGLQGTEINNERNLLGSEEFTTETWRPKLTIRYHKPI